MDTPRPYQWDYDHDSPHAHNAANTTFSIGVFQWLPKSSGKGLKRSKTIRVSGYVAEAERVFEKARELCRRLNEAGVRADAPPEWLQKQYSVPRPAGLAVERVSDDLAGAQARAIRRRVMTQRLLPAGFVHAKAGTYVRRRGEQVHLVDFQPSRWGGDFTVNLGFHYTFVPPFFARRRITLAEFQPLDAMLHARIGHFLPEQRDTWFEYGRDPLALGGIFERCAAESLGVLDRYAERWADPDVLHRELEADALAPWDTSHPDLAGACLALRLRRLDAAATQLRRWIERSEVHADRAVHEVLNDRLTRLRDHPATEGPPLDWVVG